MTHNSAHCDTHSSTEEGEVIARVESMPECTEHKDKQRASQTLIHHIAQPAG